MQQKRLDIMHQYQWPETFWPHFIENYWEQKATSFPMPADKPFLGTRELFDIVTSMKERVPSDRLWIATNTPPKTISDFTMASLDMLGPQRADRDFDTYFNRFSKYAAGVNIHNLQKVRPDLWERLEGFTEHLSKAKNAPVALNWDLDTFFGTYRSTPFGIHKDPASVFAFVLEGERTYCTWDSDYFDPQDEALHTPDLDKIEPHLKNARTFTVGPGEVFYWSSNCWHVVLSDGDPSIVVQISAYFDPEKLSHWRHN